MPTKENPNGGLLDSLEQDLTQQVQEEAAEESSTLRALLADPVPETTPVFERAIVMSIAFLLLAAVSIVCLDGLIRSLSHPDIDSSGAMVGGLVVSLAALAFVAYKLFKLWSNYKNPIFTLSLAGVQFRNYEKPTPWAHIDDYIIHTTSINGFTTAVYARFTLTPEAAAEWTQVKGSGVKYAPKKKLIASGGLGTWPRPTKLAKIIGRYRSQAYARARLAELGENV